MKSKKVFIWLVIISLIMIVIYFSIQPYTAGILHKRRFGSIDRWTNRVSRKDTWYWTEPGNYGANDTVQYVPTKLDKAFVSNEVHKIDDNFYIVGCNGVTNWFMWLGIYSYKDFINDLPSGPDDLWKYKIVCVGSEKSIYPDKYNTMGLPESKLVGYASDTILASPQQIIDNHIMLKVYYGDNYEKEKIIKIKVKTKDIELQH